MAPPVVDEAPKGRIAHLFQSPRQIAIFSFWILFLLIDIPLLGLVSEQIHRFGNVSFNYPSSLYYHALGLNLFSTIFFLLVGLTHWWFSHLPLAFLLFAAGVFFGTSAGILTATPFGHGLWCRNPVEKFPANYQPFVSQCARVMAITGLSWALFGLAVIGFFFLLADKFSCVSKRDHIYAPYDTEEKELESPIKH